MSRVFASLSAMAAERLPSLASLPRRALRAVTMAISDMAKRPLSKINPNRINSSILQLHSLSRKYRWQCNEFGGDVLVKAGDPAR